MIVLPLRRLPRQCRTPSARGTMAGSKLDGAAEPTRIPSLLRVLAVTVTTTLAGELLILLIFGVWLFPGGNLVVKAVWELGFCGIGMGLILATTIRWLVVGRFEGADAMAAIRLLSVTLLGVGCNTLCLAIDRQWNMFGGHDMPELWILSGLAMSLLGGTWIGWLLFGARAQAGGRS